uniref:Ubiquitin carboxyl-terminal hydrolase n=2 Tax=Graphocephala atropunctata TaxID=36148 RepID=A0A1B6KHF6_9HEMI
MVEFDLKKMTEFKKVPDLTLQKSLIQEKLQEPMEVGQTWVLIDTKWFKTFKQFVGFDDNVERYNGTINPGPIDNSLLLALDKNSTELKKGLVENLDYVAIPESAWQLLHGWYGLRDYQEPILRKVINVAHPPKVEPKLEVYLVELILYNNLEFENPFKHSFSAAEKLSRIEDVCRKHFDIPDDQQVVMKCFYAMNQSHVLGNKSSTIHDESLDGCQICVVPEDRSRSFTKPALPKNNSSSKIPRVVATRSTTMAEPGMMTRYPSSMAYSTLGTAEGRGPPCSPGLSGLMNLGNTCFLNSIVQCLSNCEPITKYFLDKKHEREINETNPLGKAGLIASSFADVISMMWSGLHATTVPHCFKMQLTKFAPQFAGCQQHDAQELLTFLLDGLHEDLNRIKVKPYCQSEEKEQEDDTLARTSWEHFLRRNDSIIIDHFHGMLKSRVVCPDCEKVSIKFDTFSTLSLPLPMRCDRTLTVRYVPYDQSARVVDLLVDVPKKGTIHDLTAQLNKVTQVKTNHMIIAEVHKSHFHKFFNLDDPIEEIEDRDKIFMYDVPSAMVDDPSVPFTILPVVLWEIQDLTCNPHFLSSLFGTPFLMVLRPGPILFKTFYDMVCQRMTRACEANTSSGSFPMECETADGECSKTNDDTYLFTPVLVNMYCYEKIHKIEASEHGTFEIPGNFGQEVLALQIERRVHKKHYRDETPSCFDYSDTMKHLAKPTLEDCLNLFTTTEKLGENNAWHCPCCNEKKRATKKLDLWKLPNILIFHLKRFAFNEIKREKLDRRVEFPLTGLNIDHYVANKHKENLVYDLIGVCNHYGGLMGGHYTANCKNYSDGNWYCFDDNSVTLISPESVQTEHAYVLFYSRRPIKKSDPNEEKADL